MSVQRFVRFRHIFFLAAVSSFVFFFHLGHGSLTSWNEAIYATAAREIIRSGNWLRPTFEGTLFLEKPPLCIWAVAFLYKIFGVNKFSARFFSAACGFGTIIVTYFLGARLFDRWIGLLSAMLLLTSKHFPHYSRFGVMDAPLVFLVRWHFFFSGLAERKKYILVCQELRLV